MQRDGIEIPEDINIPQSKIELIQSVEAHAPAPATVDKVLREGDHVKAGQPLVQLDAQAQAAQAVTVSQEKQKLEK